MISKSVASEVKDSEVTVRTKLSPSASPPRSWLPIVIVLPVSNPVPLSVTVAVATPLPFTTTCITAFVPPVFEPEPAATRA